MSAIRVGAVTEAKGHRYHAIVEGQAPCGSGRGKILVRAEQYVGVELTKLTAKSVCRRAACRNAIRAQIHTAQDANVHESSGPRRWAAENALIMLADLFLSSAEKAERAALVARYTASLPIAA